MKKAYLLLGSNLGERMANINLAIHKIEEVCGMIVHASSVYETAPWGYLKQNSFLNQLIVIESTESPIDLLHSLLAIEKEVGRVRDFKFGPRIIDIDILLMDQEIMNEELLILPHPELPNRKFALIPLAEVAPDLIHPVLKKNMTELCTNCLDDGHVQKFSES